MSLKLQYTGNTNIPVEVDGILPSITRDASLNAITKLPVQHGNEQLNLADLFRVSGDPTDSQIEFEGDLRGVHRIGERLSEGTIRVNGSAGRHVGSQMSGGEIQVDGDVSDFLGTVMAGGQIHVRGSAGEAVGSARPGHARGMTGGVILVDGNVGSETGRSMRRGLIAIGGSAGEFTGASMLAGSVLVFGRCGGRPGAGMRRGTIGLFGSDPPTLLPTFRRSCRYRPAFLTLLLKHLTELGFGNAHQVDGQCDLFHGDLIELGRGEIFICAT